eukprot:762559-Pleurochrysis_carterae.AAC.4
MPLLPCPYSPTTLPRLSHDAARCVWHAVAIGHEEHPEFRAGGARGYALNSVGAEARKELRGLCRELCRRGAVHPRPSQHLPLP